MLMRAAAPGGVGLGGLLVVLALLYFTGAGGWMLDRMQNLQSPCYSALSVAGPSIANPICNGVGSGVAAITRVSTSVGDALRGVRSKFDSIFSSAPKFSGLSDLSNALGQSFAGLSSSAESLQRMVSSGPQQISASANNVGQQFQQAIDSFTIGQSYAQGGNMAQALPWLQHGASQPQGFGLMSQLSLGDLYRTGGGGVAANPAQAQAYYQLASRSLAQLSQGNSPQAQQILRTLPASPQAMQQEIAKAMASLKVR